jgi:hypothetical protein
MELCAQFHELNFVLLWEEIPVGQRKVEVFGREQ